MQDISDAITGGLVALFSAPGSALAIAFAMLLSCVGILIWVRSKRVVPLQLATEQRIWRLGGGGLLKPPRRMTDLAVSSVDAIMEQPGPGTAVLRKAWARYAATRRVTHGRLRATSSAEDFFGQLSTGTAVLGWWANLFVAIGLVFTFLGVVAALSTATATIGSAGDPATTQAALADLLRITATKFWTSIAGVGSSILLRLFERRWRVALERSFADLSEQLDRLAEPLGSAELMARQADLLELIAERLNTPAPAAGRAA